MEELLGFEINTKALVDHNDSDLENVLELHELCENALTKFLAQEINVDDYLDILSTTEIGIDAYLKTIEHNLHIIGA